MVRQELRQSLTAPTLPLQALDRPYIEPCRYYLHGEQGKISSEDVEEERLEYSRQHNHPIDCTWVVTVKARRRVRFLGDSVVYGCGCVCV